MRIALIAPPWVPVPPPAYGGTETVIDLLAAGFADRGHEVLLYTTGDSVCPVTKAWALPAALGTANTNPATELHHVISAYTTIVEWGADIVHDHTLVGPVYAQGVDIPVVTTNHGPFDGELAQLYRAVSDRVGVIAISRHQASKSSHTRIAAVIHHGIDVESIPARAGNGGYAAFLGRMCPDKGVDVAARIARAGGFPLKIAAKLAEPAERDYFQTAVRPLLGGDIEYVGELGGAAKYEFLGQASCLLNPLRWDEPFGMVMIEAFACGTPVVATRGGSVPEIVQDGATGYIRDSDADLATAVGHIGDLDRLTCRNAARVRFSKDRMVRDHLDLFQAIVDDRQPSRAA